MVCMPLVAAPDESRSNSLTASGAEADVGSNGKEQVMGWVSDGLSSPNAAHSDSLLRDAVAISGALRTGLVDCGCRGLVNCGCRLRLWIADVFFFFWRIVVVDCCCGLWS